MDHSEGFLKVVEAAKKEIEEITIEEYTSRQDKGESFVLLDVREDKEWDKGHLPNATHLGKGIIERDIEKTIENKEEVIVLYCGGGFRSALAAQSLKVMGYKKVFSLVGGFKEWEKKGREIIKD